MVGSLHLTFSCGALDFLSGHTQIGDDAGQPLFIDNFHAVC